ncbi:MAG: HD domain-containing protein [Gammaproteobacteria bacterium]|nr:HD domain-containing protein [Gammaproteobacteria bacterium]
MQQVEFVNMADGTREEYEFLEKMEQNYVAGLSDRVLEALRRLENSISGYQVSRLGHSLQSATRAHRAGEPEELVIAALLHDIGDDLAPYSHGELAAAVLRPFVSAKTCWIVKHHGLFQMYYYAHHLGGDRNARERFADHPHYQATVDFCENYDQNCFDPDYETLPLEYFEPMLRRVLGEVRFQDEEHQARYGT